MDMSLESKGYLTIFDLENAKMYPSEERFEKGPVAIVECIQEIPCNPCEKACKFGAITIGEPITNLPRVHEENCSGCGVCVAQCPGLAIFIVDKTYSDEEGTVSFPFEYFPLPEAGQEVTAVDRSGEKVCDGRVVKVLNPKSFDRTPVVTVAVPKKFVEDVRSIERKKV
jgi:Fe-S-cluster-containing hydrogenase component 2